MEIPILTGIYTDNGPDMRVSYPVNLVPTVEPSGVSNSYLRPADGVVELGIGPGVDRGGLEWLNTCYRVMGTNLVSISAAGVTTVLGDVGSGGQVTMVYDFDRLAIASGGRLYYYQPSTGLQQVTDPDLGTVLDVTWIDGYFMTTDGEFLVVTEIGNPFAVNPLKYASSEADPDPVVAVIRLRNEVYAVNTSTIEVFDNVGGTLFPFQRIEGGQIQKGAVGTHAVTPFLGALAFVGGGRNEAPSVYIGANGEVRKIATQEVDRLLEGYTASEIAGVLVEARNDKGYQHLYIHLPDKTLVYDNGASQALGAPVWFVLTSAIDGFSQYRARNFIYCYQKWLVGDPASYRHGYLEDTISTHWGADVRWEFGTQIVYNKGQGVIFHEMELAALTGRVALGVDPIIRTSYSLDGQTWSQDKSISAGKIGNRLKRLTWYRQGAMRNFRIQRFQGDSQSHISIARLEARLEPLSF